MWEFIYRRILKQAFEYNFLIILFALVLQKRSIMTR